MKASRHLTLRHIQYALGESESSNEDLEREFPEWDMGRVSSKSGIVTRHIARPGETAFDLTRQACHDFFARAGIDKNDVDGIICCTQSPDYIMPSNAFLLQEYLELPHRAVAFDFNLACSGYLYGLAIVQGLFEVGLVNHVLLVTADTYSRFINRQDRATRSLFSDGAAVTLISESSDGTSRLVDASLASAGQHHRSFYIPAGGQRTPLSAETAAERADASGNVQSMADIQMDGFAVWKFIATEAPKQIAAVLSRNQLTVDDVDLFVFHQASKMTLDSLTRALRIPAAKSYMNMLHTGNCVSASIPVALADAAASGALTRGQLVVLSGFGVGLSWGTVLLRY